MDGSNASSIVKIYVLGQQTLDTTVKRGDGSSVSVNSIF
jgi:hypothetical protein